MLENGVQLDDAVGLHYKRHGLSFTNKLSAAMQHKIRTGKKLSSAFRNNKHIPEMVVSLIYVGETTATLDHIFLQLATFYDTELEQTAEALISIL